MGRRFCLSIVLLVAAGCSTPIPTERGVVECGWLDRSVFDRPDLSEFRTGYDTSRVDAEFITMLHDANPGLHVLVFLGTWCSDSKREVPRFLKIADAAGIPGDHVRFYGVDRTKKSSDGMTEKHAITKVPTFIFLKADQEVGRITESPETTLEGDMLSIFVAARTP